MMRRAPIMRKTLTAHVQKATYKRLFFIRRANLVALALILSRYSIARKRMIR